ncbi:MAG: hypothetical protein AMXMBFR17_21690 [Candidatus Jettenia caeni]
MGNKGLQKRFFYVGYIFFIIILICYVSFNHSITVANAEINPKIIEDRDRSNDCNTLVISCVDFRFVSFIRVFLTENLKIKDDYDHIAIPGSVTDIIRPETQKITFDKIDILLNLHHVNHLVLIEHKDCGAYGGSKYFDSDEKETEVLSNGLRRVRDILNEKYPNLKIDLFLASLKNVGNEKFYYMERIYGAAFNHSIIMANTEIGQMVAENCDHSNDCNTLVISCVDFRFVSFIRVFLTENLKIKDDYDHIAIPGSVTDIIRPETQKITFDKIDILLNLHHVNHLVLIEHKDCGAYGGSKYFDSDEKETEVLSNGLRRVRDILNEKYPNLKIDLFLASLKNVGNEKFYYIDRIK